MKNVWLISGAIVSCVVGASMEACSSGGSSSSSSSSGVGGATASSSSSSSSSGAGGTASTSSSSSGTGGECDKATTLHPPVLDAGPGTIYCPFSGIDGGANQYCVPGTQHCCETPENSTPTTCEPIATACTTGTGYTDWQCEDPVTDCTAATPVCCAPGASIGLGGTQGTMACANFAHTMTKTVCVAAGACTGITMCTSTSECPTGMTCTPFGKAGNDVGGCM